MPVPAALPKPIMDNWKWQEEGLCRFESPDLFFYDDNERGETRTARDALAVSICNRCPVVNTCLEHAITVPERHGIWGGKTQNELEILIRKRRRSANRQQTREWELLGNEKSPRLLEARQNAVGLLFDRYIAVI